jgi:protein SCO1/2
MRKRFILSALVIAVGAVLSVPGQTKTTTTATQEPSAAEKYFTNTELVTQDGKTVHFYNDVMKDKVVVINCFFATCKGSCLPMNRNFENIQQGLGSRVGKDVFLVSITVDPEMDTPAQLKRYAEKLHAGPGWLFLTGSKANVDFIHKKLGQYVEDKQDHANIVIIGNERTGLWKKAFGLAPAAEIVKVVESVMNDKGNNETNH